MQEKRPENVPEVMNAYRLILLILLWVFILLWISPLASFAADAEPDTGISSSHKAIAASANAVR